MNTAIYLHSYVKRPPDFEANEIVGKQIEIKGMDGEFRFCGKLGRNRIWSLNKEGGSDDCNSIKENF